MANYMHEYMRIKKAIAQGKRSNEIKGYLASGVSRAAFTLGDGYVLKYQFSGYIQDGSTLNQYEMRIYKQAAKHGHGHLLAKPCYLSPDGKFIIMEQLRVTVGHSLRNTVNDMEYQKIKDDFYNTVEKIQCIFPQLRDLHMGNIMIGYDGIMKAVDYAW